MGRALLAIAVLLLLTGCVPTREIPPAGATDAEVETYMTTIDDSLWATAQLADQLRPPVVEHVFIDQEDWFSTLTGCMTDLGYSGYDVESVGGRLYVANLNDPEAERIDWYVCQATYQVDPRAYGFMSGDMLDFLYHYNTTVLVPCLEGHGVHVSDIPSPTEAAIGGSRAGWNPYYSMYETFDPKVSNRDRNVADSCPAFPVGEQFDGMRPVW